LNFSTSLSIETVSSNNQDRNYKTVLGLKKDPFSAEPDPAFYYAFESFEQRLGLFKDLVEGHDGLILVRGKSGSGKTTLVNRYLAFSDLIWRPCRIRTSPGTASARISERKGQHSHPAYIFQDSREPIAIVDNAHKLSQRQLKFLLREIQLSGSLLKIKRLVLLGETNLFASVTNLAKTLSPEITINQIYLPGLAEAETETYLQYRMAVAGYVGRKLFDASAAKKIHHIAEGFPGPVNVAADQWLKENYSYSRKGRGIFRRIPGRPLFTFGWIAAGILIIFLAAFVFYPDRKSPLSLLKDLKPGPKVYHVKISEDLKLALNLFRQKIPPADHPLQSRMKIEITPPVEDKTVSSQPAFVVAKKQEPRKETEFGEPIKQLTKIETSIPVEEKPISSRPAVVSPENRKALREAEFGGFLPPQTKIETPPPVGKESVPSQPIVAPSEQRELAEKIEPRPAEARLPQSAMENIIEKTEERSIHSEKWLLSQEPNDYTIQLMGARDEVLLFDFVKKYQLLEQNEIAFYQTTFKDKLWFQLLYGVYPTQRDALSAADKLPPKIRDSSPWIRRLSSVQKAIRKKAAQ
jgi:septal ring-binding cell division protein DamX/type II secretory pathway predicted ATPase ExeA